MDKITEWCPFVLNHPCLSAEAWAAWVQAIGSITAILASAGIAIWVARKSERSTIRQLQSLHEVDRIAESIADHKKRFEMAKAHIVVFKQIETKISRCIQEIEQGYDSSEQFDDLRMTVEIAERFARDTLSTGVGNAAYLEIIMPLPSLLKQILSMCETVESKTDKKQFIDRLIFLRKSIAGMDVSKIVDENAERIEKVSDGIPELIRKSMSK